MHFNKDKSEAQHELSLLLNSYCREFANWGRYVGCPQYDPVLAAHMQQYTFDRHLRFDFAIRGVEVFVPLSYYSDTGDHHFHNTGWERDQESGVINILTAARFRSLAWSYAQTQVHSWMSIDQPYLATAEKPLSGNNIAADGVISLNTLLRGREEEPIAILQILSAMDQAITMEERAMTWFEVYLNVALPVLAQQVKQGQPVFPAEAILLRLDDQGLPAGVSFDTNMEDTAEENTTDLFLSGFHLLISTLGRLQLVRERTLIGRLYQQIKSYAAANQNEVLADILEQRRISRKGTLFPTLNYYRSYPNPLQGIFLSEAVLAPEGTGAVFSRYFPKEEVTVRIRPFDLERDLPLVYGWFHAEHAKPVWKMDWPMDQIELFYRTILAGDISHSYIGEINGVPTFNLEVYWATRDILGDYYEVLANDYGTHLFIAPTDKKMKFPSLTMQAILDWLFAQPQVGKLVGEGAVESLAALMNKVHVGFRLERIIEMPHKRSHLNFCHREWYWAKFPENKDIISKVQFNKTPNYEPSESI